MTATLTKEHVARLIAENYSYENQSLDKEDAEILAALQSIASGDLVSVPAGTIRRLLELSDKYNFRSPSIRAAFDELRVLLK